MRGGAPHLRGVTLALLAVALTACAGAEEGLDSTPVDATVMVDATPLDGSVVAPDVRPLPPDAAPPPRDLAPRWDAMARVWIEGEGDGLDARGAERGVDVARGGLIVLVCRSRRRWGRRIISATDQSEHEDGEKNCV